MKNLIYILALYLSISFFSCSGDKKVRDTSDYADSLAKMNPIPFLPDINAEYDVYDYLDSINGPRIRNAKDDIDAYCKIEEAVKLTPEEAAEWDERNAQGGCLIIRGSSRDCDTIVNHIHIHFTTDK